MNEKTNSAQYIAQKAWITFLVFTGGVLLLMFLYSIRAVLLQLVIGLIFALALAPLVRIMTKRGLNRAVASVLAITLTTLLLIGLIGAIASPLITQGGDLVRNAPELIDKTTSNPTVQQLDSQFQIVDRAKALASEAPRLISGSGSPVLGAVGSVFSAVSTTSVILIIALFMLIEGPTAWAQFIRLLNPAQGQFVNHVATKIIVAVSGFVNGNLFISLIAGIVTLITLLLFGVPYAFALAVLVAIFDLIPLVGATIATVVIALVALTQGFTIALIVVGIMLTYQFVEGNIIQPIVYGRAVKLSQLLIIVATIIGATLGGIIGVLLAIPVAAAVQIIIVELLRASGADIEPDVSDSVENTPVAPKKIARAK